MHLFCCNYYLPFEKKKIILFFVFFFVFVQDAAVYLFCFLSRSNVKGYTQPYPQTPRAVFFVRRGLSGPRKSRHRVSSLPCAPTPLRSGERDVAARKRGESPSVGSRLESE